MPLKKNFHPKKERFFDKNGQKHCFLTNIGIFCFNYVISMLWEIFWGALHVCRSKIGDVENSFQIRHIFESPQPRGCFWRGYATQEADQELKWKFMTFSVWKIWVLEFLGPQSWDTREGLASKSPHLIGLKMQLHKKNDFFSSEMSLTRYKVLYRIKHKKYANFLLESQLT